MKKRSRIIDIFNRFIYAIFVIAEITAVLCVALGIIALA